MIGREGHFLVATTNTTESRKKDNYHGYSLANHNKNRESSWNSSRNRSSGPRDNRFSYFDKDEEETEKSVI